MSTNVPESAEVPTHHFHQALLRTQQLSPGDLHHNGRQTCRMESLAEQSLVAFFRVLSIDTRIAAIEPLLRPRTRRRATWGDDGAISSVLPMGFPKDYEGPEFEMRPRHLNRSDLNLLRGA